MPGLGTAALLAMAAMPAYNAARKYFEEVGVGASAYGGQNGFQTGKGRYSNSGTPYANKVAPDYSQFPLPEVVLRPVQQTPTPTPTTTPTTQRPSSAPRRQNTSGKGNAIKANPGNGRGSYNPTPNAIAEAQQEVAQVAQQPIAPVTDIFTGLPAAMQGNEYARAAANGDMANAVSAQALAEAPVAVAQQAAQQAQQSRYDQLMRDYALSQIADDVAIQRYIAQTPTQYGEDIGTLYDMLYGRN